MRLLDLFGRGTAFSLGFVFAAFGAAHLGDGDAAVEEGFELAEERVAAEGTAGSGVEAQVFDGFVGTGDGFERGLPFRWRHLAEPWLQREESGRAAATTVNRRA